MALTDARSRLLPLAEELLDNRYARENLREGAEKLGDVYGRARKRRVKPSRDRKLRRQFEAAIVALDEGTAALASGRKKPKRTARKVVMTALAVTAAGAAAALALNEDLRKSVLGSAKALGEEISSEPASDGAADGSAS
jgi:short subunit dehydrogenase-like uncharacterized protein